MYAGCLDGWMETNRDEKRSRICGQTAPAGDRGPPPYKEYSTEESDKPYLSGLSAKDTQQQLELLQSTMEVFIFFTSDID